MVLRENKQNQYFICVFTMFFVFAQKVQMMSLWSVRRPERKVIHAMGQIGHCRVDFVMETLGLDVQIPGHAIDHQMSRNLTPGMVLLVELRGPVVIAAALGGGGPARATLGVFPGDGSAARDGISY